MIGNIAAGIYGVGVTPSTNSYESIATVTVGSGGQSSIAFTSIPSTYKHLQLRAIMRSEYAGDDYPVISFNGSTTTTRHFIEGNGANASAYGTSLTSADWGRIPGTNRTSGIYSATTRRPACARSA